MTNPVKKSKQPSSATKLKIRNSRVAANRKYITEYRYIATNYDASMPANIEEKNKTSYKFYAEDVTSRYAVECARTLNQEVDNARGNGRFEGNAALRNRHEKDYVRKQGIPYPGLHCEAKGNKCTNDTIKVDQKHFGIFDDHPEENSCIAANNKNYAMCQKYPEIGGGYVNIKEYVAEVQKHDPYCVIDTVVPSLGNNSSSGLHRVTIAPTIDKDGNVVIDPKTNLPKMTVYSFNKASKTPLEKYGQTHGVCFNLNDYARHNLKEEYEKNPELTQQRIDEYIASSKEKSVVPNSNETNKKPISDELQQALQRAYMSGMSGISR